MGYWWMVANRATKQAAKDTKNDTRIGVIVNIATQLLIGGGLFLAVGQLNGSNLWTRILSAIAPLLLFPAVFLIRLFTVPSEIHKEDQEKLKIANEKLDSIADRRLTREKLGDFLRTGQVLMSQCGQEDQPAPTEAANEWFIELQEFLIPLDASYTASLQNSSGLPLAATSINSEEHRNLWSGLRTIMYNLDLIIRDLR